MSIVESIFGKDNNITEQDLKNLIGKTQETSKVECKRIMGNPNFEHVVIRSIVGFLNKIDNDGGLLLLGVEATKGKIDDIKPIEDESFRRDKIRDKIQNLIGYIPISKHPFSLDVNEVNFGEGFVILIEVRRTNPNAVFFSKGENKAYIRRADSTQDLGISELFQIAHLRNYPIVYALLDLTRQVPPQNSLFPCPINVLVRNDGTAPGRDIYGQIDFFKPQGIGAVIIEPSSDLKASVPKNGAFERLEFTIFQPLKMPSYPTLDLIVGNCIIYLPRNVEIKIIMTVFENRGKTITNATLKDGELNTYQPEYIPYMV